MRFTKIAISIATLALCQGLRAQEAAPVTDQDPAILLFNGDETPMDQDEATEMQMLDLNSAVPYAVIPEDRGGGHGGPGGPGNGGPGNGNPGGGWGGGHGGGNGGGGHGGGGHGGPGNGHGGGGWGGGHGGGNGGGWSRETTLAINCSSNNLRTNFCGVPGQILSVRLARKYSFAPCVAGRSFGANRNSIWVSRGCSGQFVVRVRN
jgi:hypothetical protein